MNVIRTRVESFEPYGLNKYRNFIDPRTKLPIIEEKEELIDLCYQIIDSSTCDNCAIFIHFADDQVCVVLDNEYYYGGGIDFFAQIDAELRLCCYALLMELAPGEFVFINN